jgi:hypothetical protein
MARTRILRPMVASDGQVVPQAHEDQLEFVSGMCHGVPGAGLPDAALHTLRHSGASMMLSHGVPLEVVSATLGHSSIAITGDVYGHDAPDVSRDAVTTCGAMDRRAGGLELPADPNKHLSDSTALVHGPNGGRGLIQPEHRTDRRVDRSGLHERHQVAPLPAHVVGVVDPEFG